MSWPVASAVLVGISINSLSQLTDSRLKELEERIRGRPPIVNHDLERALQRAYEGALDELQRQWGNRSAAQPLFQQLRADSAAILASGVGAGLAGNATALSLFGQGRPGAKQALDRYLAPHLHGHGEQLQGFLRANLLPAIEEAFAEELKSETKDGNRAWRAYQRLVAESLSAGLSALQAHQQTDSETLTDIQARITHLSERLDHLPEGERDTTGQDGLQEAITQARDQIIAHLDALGQQVDQVGSDVRQVGIDVRLILAQLGINPEAPAPTVTGAGWQRISSIPHRRNSHLVGRETLLDTVAARLTPTDSDDAPPLLALRGLGGVGKTQLAVAAGYRLSRERDIVWWLRAESPVTLAADFAAIAEPLRLPLTGSANQPETIAAVHRWLEQTEHTWLLIFDNAEREEDIVPFLPQSGPGAVLVTSRNPAWGRLGKTLPVLVLSVQDAGRYLLDCTGQTDKAAAEALAKDVGRLPLALVQAAAYIDTTKISLAGYRQLLASNLLDTLARGRPAADDHASIATTWEPSFHRLETEAPAAADMLRLCAFLAPDDIPLDLLASGASALPASLQTIFANPADLTDAVGALLRYSLIEVIDDRTIAVHRLVQEVVRDRLGDEDGCRWSGITLGVLQAVMPAASDDHRNWPVLARLAAHVRAAVDLADDSDGQQRRVSWLLNSLGGYLRSRGQYSEAVPLFERALAIRERALGPDHPDTAQSYGNLGALLSEQGERTEACSLFHRALIVFTKRGYPAERAWMESWLKDCP